MLEMFLGQIPEAIYFALFMIYAKRLKEKRILFIVLMIAEYLLLKQFLHFTTWFQILYTFTTFIILKVLYKEKAQITDIFTFILASLIMLAVNAPIYLIISFTIKKFIVFAILARIVLFILFFCIKNKLYNITKIYKKIWNRNDKIPKKIKSTTFRSINIVIFNLTFYLVHIILLFELTKIGGV